MADFEDGHDNGRYDDERTFDRRDRSLSPRGGRDERHRSRSPRGERDERNRSRSPRDRPPPPPVDTRMKDADDESAVNTGSNLFVTGIHPSLKVEDITQLFSKYGDVESCSIMKDPRTEESRGFGFVKMVTVEEAEAAKEALQGESIEGRTLSIEKARRARPRTPTPGKYFGPPKADFKTSRGGRGGRFDRFDDRRGGGYATRRHDDYRGSSRYEPYGRREYGARRDREEGYGSRNIDHYASSTRDDRYSGRGDDRRGGGRGGYYDRSDDRGGYEAPARDTSYGGGRDYSSREDRYAR